MYIFCCTITCSLKHTVMYKTAFGTEYACPSEDACGPKHVCCGAKGLQRQGWLLWCCGIKDVCGTK